MASDNGRGSGYEWFVSTITLHYHSLLTRLNQCVLEATNRFYSAPATVPANHQVPVNGSSTSWNVWGPWQPTGPGTGYIHGPGTPKSLQYPYSAAELDYSVEEL